jgi:hypothetical protein
MKPAGLLLTLFLTTGPWLRAEETPAAPPAEAAKPSPGVKEAVTVGLPKYAPPVPVEAKPANTPNPDVLELPKYIVRQRPRPRLTPQLTLTNKGLVEEKFTSFDRNVLNRYTLPLFGMSFADRMRDENERAKNEQLRKEVLDLAKTTDVADPAQAKALRDAVNKP